MASSNRAVHRQGFAICIAVMIGHAEARAECTPPTPACHLENGKALLDSDPKRSADELLASYRLDERTDTLVLYAVALNLDHQYALALETWKRVIVFRESELDAARDVARTATGRKLAAARAAMARAQQQTEQAAEAILKLWSSVGRVRIRFAAGQAFAVSRGGVAVDVTRDVAVNAGRDELLFTRTDGSAERVVVEVAAGALAKVDAPAESVARPAPVKPRLEQPRPPPPEEVAKPDAPAEPDEPADAGTPALGAVRLVEEPRSRTMSRVGLGLVAGAVAAGALAGGLGLVANRDRDQARTAGCSADDRCPFGPAADLADRANDRARLAQISAIGGAALLATGVTLWLVGRGKVRRATELTLRVGPSSTAISWRF